MKVTTTGIAGIISCIILIAFIMPVLPLRSQDDVLEKAVRNREEHMKWWTETRFGMFIHRGLYLVQNNKYNK